MKKILAYVLVLVLGLAIGAGGIIFFEPSLLSKAPAPVVESLPFNPKTAVSVTESDIESNLSVPNHYISFELEFSVAPQALQAQGGSATAASGGTGTGSANLDAKIRNAMINLARSTSYGQLTSSGGLATFKAEIKEILEGIFGPGTIGQVYFPSLMTQ